VRSGETVFVSALSPHDPDKEWAAQRGGMLQFECSDSRCGLKQVWAGLGQPAVYVSSPREQEGKSTRLALIRAASSK
jgi:hypothetical protein